MDQTTDQIAQAQIAQSQGTHQQYIQSVSRQYRRHIPGIYPAQRIAVLTCMDTRIDPLGGLGFDIGDAHILRNAGGRVTEDMLRSLVLSSAILDIAEVVVLHHTGCGVAMPQEALRAQVSTKLGVDTGDMFFYGFSDLEASVKDDVELIRTHPLLPRIENVWGGVIDTETHHVTIVA